MSESVNHHRTFEVLTAGLGASRVIGRMKRRHGLSRRRSHRGPMRRRLRVLRDWPSQLYAWRR